jgi:thiamine-phosphate pyrophosphorylase
MRAGRRGLICLVTDRRLLQAVAEQDALDRLVELARAAADTGVDIFQVRERDLDSATLLEVVRRCVGAVAGSRTKVLVNDRADVAMAAGAHGVHLRGDSYTVRDARKLLAAKTIIARSIHSAREAEDADLDGADFLVFGTLFETGSKPPGYPTATLREFAEACAAAACPVLAIGGISVDRAREVARHGGAGVAGIGLFLPAPGVPAHAHLGRTVHALREAFDSPNSVS